MTPLAMDLADWAAMLGHFLSLSLVAVGGAITTVPDMHRYLVTQENWLTERQFAAAISLAQAAPGPNILFVALLGWNIGLNSGSVGMGLAGVAVSMVGILLPSTTLSYLVSQWGNKHREHFAIRAFRVGMAPVVIALLLSTGTTLAASVEAKPIISWTMFGIGVLALYRLQVHVLWLLATGALFGAFAFN